MVAMVVAMVLASQATPVVLRDQTVSGVRVRVIEANLSNPRVRVDVALAEGFPGTDEPFESIVSAPSPKPV